MAIQCKACRKRLYESIIILEHERGQGQVKFEYRKRTNYAEPPEIVCSHVFLDILPQEYQGKVECDCGSKIGMFDLGGIHCSCGNWVSPGFALAKSKIDYIEEK